MCNILLVGGAGGLGGRGMRCPESRIRFFQKFCSDDGATGRAPRGSRGSSGAPGKSITYILI